MGYQLPNLLLWFNFSCVNLLLVLCQLLWAIVAFQTSYLTEVHLMLLCLLLYGCSDSYACYNSDANHLLTSP